MELPQHWRVACHTDHVGSHATFVAIQGQNNDGVQFILDAVSRGAQKIVVSTQAAVDDSVKNMLARKNIPLCTVENTRAALAQLSAQAYDYPHKKLTIIGITGTKGKTTTACAAFHLLRTAGYSVALISTVYNRINEQFFEAPLTTPQPDYLHMFFAHCVANGVTHVVMEVAAQAMTLHRLDGILFDMVVFTNIDQEHGEFYATFAHYFDAKIMLLKQVKPDGMILLNADDERIAALKTTFPNAQLYSVHDASALWYTDLIETNYGTRGNFRECTWHSPTFSGAFNGSNITAALAIAVHNGVESHQAATACATVPAIPGRLEQYSTPIGAQYIIDYAHTPASYTQLLSLLRTQTDHLVVLFGAGGAKDHRKRPLMGAIAAQYADVVLLTSDNPRYEDPKKIIDDLMAHMSDAQKKKVIIELDREKAIKKSYKLAKKCSIIALLGKGPDEFQIVGDQKTPFYEKEIIKQLR